jgi:hypothetical protein
VKAGSTVVLHCVVRGALEPPSYIIWYHDAHQLLSENQQKWKIKLDRGSPDDVGDIPNVVSCPTVLSDLNVIQLINYVINCSPARRQRASLVMFFGEENLINELFDYHSLTSSSFVSFSLLSRG